MVSPVSNLILLPQRKLTNSVSQSRFSSPFYFIFPTLYSLYLRIAGTSLVNICTLHETNKTWREYFVICKYNIRTKGNSELTWEVEKKEKISQFFFTPHNNMIYCTFIMYRPLSPKANYETSVRPCSGVHFL